MAICIVIYLIIGMISTINIYRELDKIGFIDSYIECVGSSATVCLLVGLIVMTLLWPVLGIIGKAAGKIIEKRDN